MIKDKTYYAQKFGVPERDITPEFIPLLVALEENFNATKEFSEKIKGTIKTIHYENPKTALFGNLGLIGVPVSVLFLSISMIYWGWVYKETSQAKYKNLERLTKIVEVRNDAYFVHKDKYRIVKGGVRLLE